MKKLPKILFLVDVINWAYDFRAKKWKQLLENEFDIDILYLENCDNKQKVFNDKDYDGIVFFYHRAIRSSKLQSTPFDKNKVAICINNEKWILDGEKYTYEKYFKDVKLLIACNDFILNTFSKYHKNIQKVTQVVDESLFFPNRNRIVSGRTRKSFRVGWNGNVNSFLKNLDWLKTACSEAKVQLSIANNLNQIQLNDWYNNIDCVSCVSLPFQEGGPNMLLESGSCRLPIITTPVGLSREIIKDNYNGLITPHFDLCSLIEKLKLLSVDRHLRSELSKNLFKEIRKNWTYQARLYEIKQALMNLIS